eukprot:2536266-Amphidinium_carterae.1
MKAARQRRCVERCPSQEHVAMCRTTTPLLLAVFSRAFGSSVMLPSRYKLCSIHLRATCRRRNDQVSLPISAKASTAR